MTSSILILRAGALGDTILALPAVEALRHAYPDARIEVIGYREAWSLATPFIDTVYSADHPRYAGLFGSSAASSPLPEADLQVLWSTSGNRASSRTQRSIAASPYPPPGVHAATWLLSTLESLGIQAGHPRAPELRLTESELAAGRAVLGAAGLNRPVLIHPGAGAPWKRWPAARFATVAGRLRASGYEVALVAGPADDVAVREVLAHVPLPVLRDLPPRPLAAVLAHASLYLGNDSGVSHLAAAAGARTISLFGPTDPASWAPLGTVQIVRHCTSRPLGAGDVRICDDPACMEGITVDHVMEAVDNPVQNRQSMLLKDRS